MTPVMSLSELREQIRDDGQWATVDIQKTIPSSQLRYRVPPGHALVGRLVEFVNYVLDCQRWRSVSAEKSVQPALLPVKRGLIEPTTANESRA